MFASFRQDGTQAGGSPGQAGTESAGPDVDWRAVRLAERACCCPSRPACVAIMPPAPGRERKVDILLCNHHYRASLSALAAARAIVLDVSGARLHLRLASLR